MKTNVVRRISTLAIALVAMIGIVNTAAAAPVTQGSLRQGTILATVEGFAHGCNGAFGAKTVDNGRTTIITYNGAIEKTSDACTLVVPGYTLEFGSMPGYIDGNFVVTTDANGIITTGESREIVNPQTATITLTSRFTAALTEGPRP